jgi:hypothetical protein
VVGRRPDKEAPIKRLSIFRLWLRSRLLAAILLVVLAAEAINWVSGYFEPHLLWWQGLVQVLLVGVAIGAMLTAGLTGMLRD